MNTLNREDDPEGKIAAEAADTDDDRGVHASANRSLEVEDSDEDLDEDTAALIWALAELSGEQVAIRAASWDPAKHPRGPDGKFLSVVDRLKAALTAHLKGDGKGDPFEGFSREQLRKAAKARGLDVPKGASREHIADLLFDDLSVKAPAVKKAKKVAKKAVPATPKLFGHTDISAVPADVRAKVFGSYKGQPKGKLLSHPAADSYDNLVALAHVHGKDVPGGLSPGQVAAIIDERLAAAQGLDNTHLLENKIRKWLQTGDGEAYAREHHTPDPGIVSSITGDPTLPAGVKLKAGQKIQKLGGPGKYTVTGLHEFRRIDAAEAQSMQDSVDAATGTKISNEQFEALAAYTAGEYSAINGWLRDDPDWTDPGILARQHAAQLQSTMLPMPESLRLLRGSQWYALPEGYRDAAGARKLIGKTVEQPGFTSTSPVRVPSSFEGPIRWVIQAPAGTNGRYVERYSSNPTEYEVILAAGQKFRFLSVTDVNDYPFKVEIRVRVVTPK